MRDGKNQILTWAQDTIRAVAIAASLQGDVGLLKHARKSESKYRLQAMIQLAAADPRVVLSSDQLDSDPCLFNVQNGTIDLRTGAVSPHDPGQLITKLCPVAYDRDDRGRDHGGNIVRRSRSGQARAAGD